MRNAKVIRGYAQALFEVTSETNQTARVLGELEQALKLLTSEWRKLSENPAFRAAERRAIVDAAGEKMEWSKTTIAFLTLITEHRRIRDLKAIVARLHQEHDRASGLLRITVRAARELNAAQQSKIIALFKNSRYRELALDVSVDPQLLGGVILQCGSKVYDGSVRGRLRRVADRLMA